jgi:hypothetical protein
MNSTSWWWFEDNFLPPQMKNVYPRINPIDYKVNSYGYRCPEFDTIDWENSYVLLGASNIFGEGVLEDETISYYLEQMLREPVINLGFAAASNQHLLLTMSMLAKKHKPKKWIVSYLDSSRWLHWDSTTMNPIDVQAHRASHEQFCGEPWPQLMESLDWYSSQSRVSVQAIAKSNMIEFGFGEQIDKDWNVKAFDLVDEGRVAQHPGPQTNKMIAEWLYKEIRRHDETDQ